jgi:hypothetical protein
LRITAQSLREQRNLATAFLAVCRGTPDSVAISARTEHERVLVACRQVFQRDGIDLDADWHTLGGDSLDAIRAAALVAGREMPVSVTAAQLLQARSMRAVTEEASLPLVVDYSHGASQQPYEESGAAHQLPALGTPADTRTPDENALRLDGELSEPVTSALRELARRHDLALRDLLLASLHRALEPITTGDGLYALIHLIHDPGRHLADGDVAHGGLNRRYPVLLIDESTHDSPRTGPPGSHARRICWPPRGGSTSNSPPSLTRAPAGQRLVRLR